MIETRDIADSDRSVDAVVLVGGKGTRLRPLTLSAPKPMLPTAGVPFVAHLLARIRDAGISHVVLGTSYKAEVFSEYFGDGSAFGLEIEYVFESEPLGTGGGIRNVASHLRGDTAIVFNGDVLSGCDLPALLKTHRDAAADLTLHLTRVGDPRAFGCVPTDSDGRVTAFLEKDPNPVTDQINAGTYVFRREILEQIPTGRPVSVERETFPGLLAAGALVVGHIESSYWRDLGTPADFIAGSADLVQGRIASSALPAPAGDAIVLPGAKVADDAKLVGGTVVGADCIVESGVTLDGAVLFDGVRVCSGAQVRSSVLGFESSVGPSSVLDEAVVGDRAQIGANIELRAGARVWPDAVLADGSLRFSSDG
ncbi:mannose-1-phosphate guanylyltransferase [Jatrophihabitans sp. GAS493]|uniref:sugar phosphate nucleotidyltransferase n=1 Tax=Jatrophihabitans sp. GAS493 TaxID=1907575 RepID=UPI000BBF76DD|nr:NDP-sugar synthase [Jatrophihabitans sp. GAS493]SOD73017.1 mannose-1-phosphate guanylyltransferase [Jatrophihabitans sp. GAS493]